MHEQLLDDRVELVAVLPQDTLGPFAPVAAFVAVLGVVIMGNDSASPSRFSPSWPAHCGSVFATE